MDFQEMLGGLYVVVVARDGTLELILSVSKSVVLVGQVSREFRPSASLLIFGVIIVVAWFDKLLSKLDQELEDLLDSLLVNLSG